MKPLNLLLQVPRFIPSDNAATMSLSKLRGHREGFMVKTQAPTTIPLQVSLGW